MENEKTVNGKPDVTLRQIPDHVLKVLLKKHEKWVRKKRGGQKLHLNFFDLSGRDFSGRDLSGADLFGSDLSNTNFTNTNLYAAVMILTNLHRANFSNACLANAYLMDSNATYAYFKDVDLSHANLKKADFRHAILVRADLQKASLLGLDLTGAYVDAVKWPYRIPKSVKKENCMEEALSFREYTFNVQVTGVVSVRVIAESEESGRKLATFFASEEQCGKLQDLKYTVEETGQIIM